MRGLSLRKAEPQDALTAGGKFEYTPTGLVLHGTPTRDEWLAAYAELEKQKVDFDVLQDMFRWNAGDMLLWGEERGDEWAQAVDWDSDQTFRNAMTLCRKLPRERRYHPSELRFWTHYELVVGIDDPKEQDRLLAQAVAEGWKKLEAREAKQLSKGIVPPKKFTAYGTRPTKDVRGTEHVIVAPYNPRTEDGELPTGKFKLTIEEA